MAAYQRRWTDVEQKVTTIGARYGARMPRMRMACDGEGGGSAECVAERARYSAALVPLLYARDAEILPVEAATGAKTVALARSARQPPGVGRATGRSVHCTR